MTIYGQGSGKKTLKILTPAQIDPSRLLPPPALDDSEAAKKEMAEVKRQIKTRTAKRFAQAKWDAEHEDASAFAEVMGPQFDLKQLPAAAKLLDLVLNDQAVAASTAKDYFAASFRLRWNRPKLDSRIGLVTLK